MIKSSPQPLNTVLIISTSDISVDSRVLRQIYTLSRSFTVTTIGFGSTKPSYSSFHYELKTNSGFFQLMLAKLFFLFRFYRIFFRLYYNYHEIFPLISLSRFNAFILNDASTWPLLEQFYP